MSKSAGTLITTNNATYIHPRFMPGYKGHVPTMKFDYGETYGNHTAKYFQDFRSSALERSKTNYCKGGYFPTYYSYNCDLATEARTRKWDRWLQNPRYSLTNYDHDKREELIRFDKLAKGHREQYNDKSGTAQRVDYFMLPNKTTDPPKNNGPFAGDSAYYRNMVRIPARERTPQRMETVSRASSSQRDREMRDLHFERR